MKKLLLTLAILLASCWTDSDDGRQENTVEPAGAAKKTVVASGIKGPFPIGRAVYMTAGAPAETLAKAPAGWTVLDSARVGSKSDFKFSIPDTTLKGMIRIDGAFLNEFSAQTEDVEDASLYAYVDPDSSVSVNILTHLVASCTDTKGGYTTEVYDECEEIVLTDFGVDPSALLAGYRDDAGLGVLLGVSNIATASGDFSIFRDSTRSVMRYDRYYKDLVQGLVDTTLNTLETAEVMKSDTGMLARCDIAVDNLTDSIYINIEALSLSNDSAVRFECKQYVSMFVYGVDYNDSTLAVFDWLGSEDYGSFRGYRTFQKYPAFCGDWDESVNGLAGHINCYQKMLDAREL